MTKNNNDFRKISEKNSKSSSYRSSSSFQKKDKKAIIMNSNQNSSNSDELLDLHKKARRENDPNEFSTESFKSVLFITFHFITFKRKFLGIR